MYPVAAMADQSPQKSDVINMSAAKLAYFADEKMLEARGAVRVMLSNGVEIDGDACVVNLGLQRFVVAGHVTAFTPAGRYSGAAFPGALERVDLVELGAGVAAAEVGDAQVGADDEGRIVEALLGVLAASAPTSDPTPKSASVSPSWRGVHA